MCARATKIERRGNQRGTPLPSRVSRGGPRRVCYRSLRYEPLEERRLLALGDLVYKIYNPDPELGYQKDNFGAAVSISGSTVAVAAPQGGVDDTGVVHLFHSETGALLRTIGLADPSLGRPGSFGCSVAISGNIVVVGWILTREGDGWPHCQVFDVNTGQLLHTLRNPSPMHPQQSGTEFGAALAVSGNLIAVGDPKNSTKGLEKGAVHVFDAVSGNLLHTIYSPLSLPRFGWSLEYSGNRLIAGCDFHSPAYVFDAFTGELKQTLYDPSTTGGHRFGTPVAMSGTRALVTSAATIDSQVGGAVHLFDAATGACLRTFDDPTPASDDRFGYMTAIAGPAVLVSDRTQALLYHADTGALLKTFSAPRQDRTMAEGYAASGNRFVVGEPDINSDPFVESVSIYDISLGAQYALTSFTPPAATEGAPIVNAEIARFNDTNAENPTATITWADGTRAILSLTPSPLGQIVHNVDGSYSVQGTHTYRQAIPAPGNLFSVTVSDTYLDGGSFARVTVASVPLQITEIKHPVGLEIKTDQRIAHFTDANPLGAADDYTATIIWFDQDSDAFGASGSTVGTIRANAAEGGFDVFASHSYDTNIDKPRLKFAVNVSDSGGATDTKEQLPQNYALLFSGGANARNNYSQYYWTIRGMYDMLVATVLLDPKDIYILYADGVDPANDANFKSFKEPDERNSNMAYAAAAHVLEASQDNLKTTLIALASVVTAGDHFLFYTFDHGGGTEKDAKITDEEVLNGWNWDNIRDDFLPPWLRLVQAGYNTYVFAQCFSGGLIDDLLPLPANQFAAAAANHYESSHGKGFAAGFGRALDEGHLATQAAFRYAKNRDPYAAFNEVYEPNGGKYTQDDPDWHNQTEHPFALGKDFPIFYRPGPAPALANVIPGGGLPDLPVPMPYNSLANASDATAADGNGVAFLITGVSSGALTMNGSPVVPGETVVGYGDTLLWTPPPGALGLQQAFTVRAWDGQNVSATDVPVQVNLVAPADWSGGMLEVTGGDADNVLHCGAAALGQSSDVCSFSLANLGPQTLTITNFAKVGDHLADFGVTVRDGQGQAILSLPAAGGAATGGTGFAVPAGASYTIDVVFVPQALEVRNLQFTFHTNDPRDQGQPRLLGADGVGVLPYEQPTLTAIGTLAQARQGRPFEVAWPTLVDASDLGDANPDPHPVFRVEQVFSGTLTWNGRPVVPGETEIGIGQSLLWTPPAGVVGECAAFSVRAGDGPLYSAADVPVVVNVQPFGVSTCGAYDPTTSTFYLRYANDWGNPDNVFQYAIGAGWAESPVPGSPPLPPAGLGPWKPFAGDWNGDGTDTIGLYDPATSWFHLRNSNSAGGHDVCFAYGSPGSGWIPLVGDWDGNGTVSVGLFDPETSMFYLRNSLDTGSADVAFAYGAAHLPLGERWQPIVSDWDGNATATVGFFDPHRSWFYLHNSHTTGFAEIEFPYGAPGSNWMTVMADWNGDNGQSTMGFYLPDASHWYLSNSNEHIYADLSFGFGAPGAGWLPVVGRWTGAGQALRAVGSGEQSAVSSRRSGLPIPSPHSIAPLLSEALARWADAGASIAAPQVVMTDLPGAELGRAQGNTIYLDRDAAGYGWFVDPTPAVDEEFRSAADPRASDRIDLLTVIEHELGHLAGLKDLDSANDALMNGTLGVGVRRLPTAADVDAVFADVH